MKDQHSREICGAADLQLSSTDRQAIRLFLVRYELSITATLCDHKSMVSTCSTKQLLGQIAHFEKMLGTIKWLQNLNDMAVVSNAN